MAGCLIALRKVILYTAIWTAALFWPPFVLHSWTRWLALTGWLCCLILGGMFLSYRKHTRATRSGPEPTRGPTDE